MDSSTEQTANQHPGHQLGPVSFTLSSILPLIGDYGSRSPLEAASFIQAWLFFGTISEVTGVPVRGTNFIRPSGTGPGLNNRHVITTHRLGFYLDIWRTRAAAAAASSARQAEATRERARICLDFLVHLTTPVFLVPEHPEVAVSIEILLVVLVDTFKEIYGAETWDVPSDFSADSEDRALPPGANMGIIRYLKGRMIAQGWCPHRVASFGDVVLSDALYTLSLMGTRELLAGHGGCSEDGCVGNQVDDRSYNETPRHVREGCGCGFVGADMRTAARIIEDGKIPVVTVALDPDTEKVSLRMVSHEPDMAYIAISHVWAHGLGNPDENALRACQLLNLDRLVKGALKDQDLCQDTTTAYFWIDTLCLPLTPANARKSGIQQMRRCYEAATAVLVLDKHLLRSTGYTPSATTEPLLQIAICDWRYRVWTLQEAIFAKRLVFQFLDMTVDAEELILAHYSAANPAYPSAADQSPNLSVFLGLRLLPALGVDLAKAKGSNGSSMRVPRSSLRSLMLSLKGRAISKPEDEPLCSASLLGQDHVLGAILQAPKRERMKTFWSAQARVPAWVPFLGGSKLQDSGYTWAPATLRFKNEITAGIPGEGEDLAIMDSGGQGLRIAKPGFVGLELMEDCKLSAGAREGLRGKAFRIIDDQGCWYDIARSEDMFNGALPELGRDIAVIVSEWVDTYHPRVLVVVVEAADAETDVITCRISWSSAAPPFEASFFSQLTNQNGKIPTHHPDYSFDEWIPVTYHSMLRTSLPGMGLEGVGTESVHP
ncbi:hypothetical protein BJY04DRAFT_215054 [Aspergillus karnatakaensis]|uniref:uncharacterized protein n=1 Tax=Aspergillus karnatakaensis TaxID=1810916 RepID=UPI003CCDBCFF